MKADREHCVDDQETGRITIKVTKLEKNLKKYLIFILEWCSIRLTKEIINHHIINHHII